MTIVHALLAWLRRDKFSWFLVRSESFRASLPRRSSGLDTERRTVSLRPPTNAKPAQHDRNLPRPLSQREGRS